AGRRPQPNCQAVSFSLLSRRIEPDHKRPAQIGNHIIFPHMNWAEMFVKLTLRTLFDTPAGLGQMLPIEAQDIQSCLWSIALPAPKAGAIHIPVRFVFEKKAIGFVVMAFSRPFPLDAFYIGHAGFAALGQAEIAHLLTL